MKTITANLIVDSIEQCLPFYVEKLGFERVTDVPEGDTIGFIILKHGITQLMLQSVASVAKDVPPMAKASRATLYIHVEDLEAIKKKLSGWPRAIPDRKTFYGANEVIVQDPAGNFVFFAQH